MNTSTARVRIGTVAVVSVFALAAMVAIASSDPQGAQSVAEAPTAAPFPPPSRPIPFGVQGDPGPTMRPSAVERSASAPAVTSGTWTPLNNQPESIRPASVFLLTDGRILVQDGNLSSVGWWILTPDNTGSYINGAWHQVASPPDCYNYSENEDLVYSPLYYASAVLPDGRFVMIGGEYDYDYNFLNDNGEVWTNQGAIYDPLANNWTCIAAPSGWTEIGDAQSVVLPNGTFMLAQPISNEVATLNVSTNPPTFNSPFEPAGKSADGINDEEGWTLLPDGTVLTIEIYNATEAPKTPALVYSPSQMQWNSAGLAPDPLALRVYGGNYYDEIGPAMLRPNGTVFAVGATGFNDIYDVKTGTWTKGPAFPTITDTYTLGDCNLSNVTEQLVAADAPAALLPDGNVLVAAAPVDINPACSWIPPTIFFEFDGASLTQVAAPVNAANDRSYLGRLLVLPTGQVLFTDDSNNPEIYTAIGTFKPAWAPTITSSPARVSPGGTNFLITGTQFNGLSQAIAYGDDYQAATNYPLVRITNNATKHVSYARTHDHSTMAVATGSATVSTKFDVPASIELGPSTLVVVANGIPSQPVNVRVSTDASPTPTPAATPTPGGKIAISATPVVFPDAGIGEAPAFAHFIVQNTSAKWNLVGKVGAPIEPFTITAGGGAFNLGPLSMLKVKLTFTPAALGLVKGSMIVTSNDRADPSATVILKGTGLPGRLATNLPNRTSFTSSDESLLFGAVKHNGPSKVLSFKIENVGIGELQGKVGTLMAPFTVTAGSGAFNLAPGATERVTVRFAPTNLGHVGQPLTITVASPNRPPGGITISVGGRGA